MKPGRLFRPYTIYYCHQAAGWLIRRFDGEIVARRGFQDEANRVALRLTTVYNRGAVPV